MTKHLAQSALRVHNGRIVSPTLNDPCVKREVAVKKAALRQDLTELRAYYVRAGVLTKRGNLTKRYGG